MQSTLLCPCRDHFDSTRLLAYFDIAIRRVIFVTQASRIKEK